jgi:2-hydroxy-3-oxopropionate reductase
MKKTIGFIGLGIMGKPMAINIMKAGFPLVVFSRSKASVEQMVKAGALSETSPKGVAEKSEVLITMLPDSPEVEQVILGSDGVIQGIKPGAVVIDMSSINPLVTKKIAEELKKKDVEMLDAPVSGGDIGAIQATLTIMVGGKESVFENCMDIFGVIGKNISYVGGIGSGGYIKLVNQVIGALNMAAIGEAFCLGVKAGLDPQLIYKVVRGGMAGNQLLEVKAPIIFGRKFKPGFKTKLHYKDLSNALYAAKGLGVPLPLTSLVQEILVSLISQGRGEDDNSVLVTFFEKMAGVEIKTKDEACKTK